MRNPHAPHIDFTELTGLLGKVVPSNLDMVYERRGIFLVGEWKRDKEKVPKGQEILLKALSGLSEFTVLIIQGWTENLEMTVQTFWRVTPEGCVKAGYGIYELKDFITEWYMMAEILS